MLGNVLYHQYLPGIYKFVASGVAIQSDEKNTGGLTTLVSYPEQHLVLRARFYEADPETINVFVMSSLKG